MTTTEAARLAAHRAWADYAPEAAQVARDAAIDKGWPADRWFRAYQGVQPWEPPIGWPVGIATVSHRAWRPSRATLRSPGAWAPNAACYSWWIGSLTKPGGLWRQDGYMIGDDITIPLLRSIFGTDCYPLHKAANRAESILVLGAILLPHLPPLHNFASWESVARTAPYIPRHDPALLPSMPF